MSLRYEQYNALLMTREFLRELSIGKAKKVSEIRERARRCLHHFPFLHKNGQPMWSRDEFTEDK
jgi:hypothetical protein